MLQVRSGIVIGLAIAMVGVVDAADYQTVLGELTAPSCAVTELTGESSAARTMRCARQGVPMAIQTSDSLLYVEGDYTANNNAKLLDFVAKPVEAKGEVTERDGRMTIKVAAMAARPRPAAVP